MLLAMTIAAEPQVRLRPPQDALRRLTERVPSDRALGRMLGTDNHAIAGWRNATRQMRKKHAQLVAYMDALVEALSSVGVHAGDLEYVIDQPWGALGSRSPKEVFEEGELEPVLKAVPAMFGEQIREETAVPNWKDATGRELEESVAGALAHRPLHEDFTFLHELSAEEVHSFAETARVVLAGGITELEWNEFLDQQFASSAAKPAPSIRAAVAEPDYDDHSRLRPEDILIIPDGGMASLRFASER
jgi:hypothetical protein